MTPVKVLFSQAVSEEKILEIQRPETKIGQYLLADGDEMRNLYRESPSNCRFIWRSYFRGEHRPGEVKNGGEFRCSTVKSGKSIVGDRGNKKST